MKDKDIYDFLCGTHRDGREGFTDEGFDHYMNILSIIKNKFYNPEIPESKFVTLCFEENLDYAKRIADTRNKEAFDVCDLFRKFINHIKESGDYICHCRNLKLEKILKNE